MIRDLARDFAEKEVRPIAESIDREARFPRETVARMAELGLMGIAVPEAYGGSGGDTVAYALAVEELARACASHAVIMSVNNSLYCDPVCKYGTEGQKARFLTPYAAGQKIGSFALTEPEAGSDASNQSTLATQAGDDYVLDGRKVFVTNGREASAALVFAQTDRAAGHRGISAFLVEKGTPGFTVVKTEDKLGIRASDTAELLFEGCRVPASQRLGEVGQGFRIALGARDRGLRGRARVRARAEELRGADRPAPDGAVDARGHGHHHRGGPPAHPARGLAQGLGRALRPRGGHGQAVR